MDIDKFRTPYESNAEWRLRKVFLLANLDKFDDNRLVCLSHCYVNVRQMGCNYPSEVMKQLNELSKGLSDEDLSDLTKLPSRIRGVEPVKFVRSTECEDKGDTQDTDSPRQLSGPSRIGKVRKSHWDECTSSLTSYGTTTSTELSSGNFDVSFVASSTNSVKTSFGLSTPKKVVPVFGMSFVKASSEYKSTDVAMHEVQHEPKKGPNSISSSSQKPVNRSKGSGLGYSTPKYSTEGISDYDMRFRTLSQAVNDLKKKFGTSKNSIEILQMAVDKAKMSLDCKIRDVAGSQHAHTFVSNLTIDFVEVGEGKGANKKTAKHTAFDSAISKLQCAIQTVDQSNPDKLVLRSSDETLVVQPRTKPPEKTTGYHQQPCIKYSNNSSFYCNTADSYDTSQYNTYDTSQYNTDDTQLCYDTTYPFNTSVSPDSTSLYESNFKSISVGNKKKRNSLEGDITKFIIFENLNLETYNGVAVLRQSCDINKALLEFHFTQEPDSANMNCRVDIEGNYITDASGVGKINCKTLACLKAVDQLRKICWTIKIKQSTDCAADENVSRDEVMGEIKKQMETISDDNIGNKLLKKMGWSGGGVGAEGNIGREEPVAVSMQQIIGREGLGLNSNDGMKDFRSKARTVVENYAKSDSQDDLVLASDFTKEERAFIHNISQRLGLKSLSRGKGDDRYLTLSRKRTTNQLFNHLLREGGSTHKYELVPPEDEEIY